MRRLAFLAALLCLAPALADDETPPLKFAWPVPSRAVVTEKTVKLGRDGASHAATMRYSISLERSGDDLRLHFGDFSFVDFDGRSATDPALAPTLSMALMMAKLTPDVLIAADGKVKDMTGLDAALKALVDDAERNGDERQKAMIPALRAQLQNPQVQAEALRTATKPWQAWVGDWIGRVLPEGRDVEVEKHPVNPEGADLLAPTVMRRAATSDGLTMLSWEASLDGDATKPALDLWIRRMAQASRQVPPEGFFTGMKLSQKVVVAVDPATLRPQRAMREMTRAAHRKDKDDLVEIIERREYAFAWPAESAK